MPRPAAANLAARGALLWLASGLDRVRSDVLIVCAPVLSARLLRGALRTDVIGAALVAVALATALFAPLWSIAVAPIVWGIPHLLADLRYLVVQPGYHRRPLLYVAVGGGCVAAAAGAGLPGALVGVAAALLLARASFVVRVGAAAAVLLAAALLATVRPVADLVFAHAHNLVGIAFLLWWRPRLAPLPGAALVGVVFGSAVILSGIADPLLLAAPAPPGFDVAAVASFLAPGLAPAPTARLLALFAFLQSVHYVVWLFLVPAAQHGPTHARSFRAALRAAWADLGVWPIAAAAAGMLALGVWALIDLGGARSGYLSLAYAHGYVELAAAGLFVMEGRR